MLNEHAVDYHPSPSEFTSRIHPLIFLCTPKGFILQNISWFFSQTSLSHHDWKKCFKFMVLRLLENTFVSQRIESVHFYSCPQARPFPRFLSSLLQAEGNYPFPQKKMFWKSIFPQQRGRGLWNWKYGQNQTYKDIGHKFWYIPLFATFTFLVSVLLRHHNLDSGMLKCEGSLI